MAKETLKIGPISLLLYSIQRDLGKGLLVGNSYKTQPPHGGMSLGISEIT